MASVNYTLRLDETDKAEAESVFKDLGMSFATGMNIYVKTVRRLRRIPFNMDLNETPPQNTLKSAFEALQRESTANGNVDLSLNEINDIVAEVRGKK